MVTKKWTYEACYEEAKKYKTRGEFQKGNGSAYNVARQNDWLNDYDWFENGRKIEMQKRQIWTKEKCLEVALKCKTLEEFYKLPGRAYQVSVKNKWIDDFDWLTRKDNIFESKSDNVYAYFFKELKSVYIGRTIDPYNRNLNHKMNTNDTVSKFVKDSKSVFPEMIILETNLTITEGLEKEDFYVNKYREEGWNILNKAKTGVKSGSIGKLGKDKWTYNKCYEEAKKYKTRYEFQKGTPSAYNAARKNKWLDNFDWLSPSATGLKWTEEMCYEEAKKYKTRYEFQKGNPSAYNASRKNGWFDRYTWFSPSATGLKPIEMFTNDMIFEMEYKSAKEASEKTGISRTAINNNLTGRSKSAGGYIFRYKRA